jgi:MarR family transcriptional regulator for hemolysin
MHPYGISQGQFIVLKILWAEEGKSQKDLCEMVGVEQPTLARTLQRMKRDGLIKIIKDKKDKRIVRIFLTEKGRELESDMKIEFDIIKDDILHDLTEEEQECLDKMLNRVIESIKKRG